MLLKHSAFENSGFFVNVLNNIKKKKIPAFEILNAGIFFFFPRKEMNMFKHFFKRQYDPCWLVTLVFIVF